MYSGERYDDNHLLTDMDITLDVSQIEISPLNLDDPENMC